MRIKRKTVKRIVCFVILLIVVHIGFFWYATTSSQWKYAKNTFSRWSPNYDFRNCIDLPQAERRDYTNSSWKPMPCINTASAFYNDKVHAACCNKFMQNPAQWGFRRITKEEAEPGDLMLFLRKKDGARHAGVYTMNSLLGPLCANTVICGMFVHFLPIKPFLIFHVAGFCEVRYYRHI